MAEDTNLIALAADIAASFVANNRVSAGEVGDLIRSVHEALSTLGATKEEPKQERPQPAVPVRKSVQADYIVDLFTGKKMKMLKRYLATAHGMTPAEYRSYWGLPSDYPMVAPNYSESRKTLAKAIGLGRKAGTKVSEIAESVTEKAGDAADDLLAVIAPKKRGRKPKAAAEAAPEAPAPEPTPEAPKARRGRKPKADAPAED